MKPSVIREMTKEEVADRLTEEREKYTKLKLAHAVSPLENPLQLRELRKDIARLENELIARETAVETEAN
ncbi:MAG: 50S ribosomal protein L29 [Bacteroidota bacterium]